MVLQYTVNMETGEGTYEEYVAPPYEEKIVFKRLTPISFVLGMLRLNITETQVDAAIAGLPEPDRSLASVWWKRATGFERDNPLIDQIAALFGKTPGDVDNVWLQVQDTE